MGVGKMTRAVLGHLGCLVVLALPATAPGQDPSIKSITQAVKIRWDSEFGKGYRVLWSLSPGGPWEGLGDVIPGTGTEMCAYDDIAGSAKKFYRLDVTDVTPAGMVPVPGGTYEMGDHFGVDGPLSLPVHTVRLDSFYMDATEVTNSDFCVFLNAALQRGQVRVEPGYVRDARDYDAVYAEQGDSYSWIEWDKEENAFRIVRDGDDHPAIGVYWYGAAAYCNWRSEQENLELAYDLETWKCDFRADGYRLPTEAEWEYAARGDLRYAMYPWGDDIDGTRANYSGSGDFFEFVPPFTTPVGSFPPNSYGLYDMAGNAAEVCHDWLDLSYYQYCVDNGITDNPIGPASDPYGKRIRVVRGGSAYDYEEELCLSFRSQFAGYPEGYVGFRCVRRPRSP